MKELNELGQSIFAYKYAYPGETKWPERAKAIAKHVAAAEPDSDKEKWQQKFYETIGAGDLVPGGRIIFGSGRLNQNLLNCYVIEPSDSVESIGKTVQDMYKISCGGGGIGFNFSKIRPRGDDIQNIRYSSPGSVSVMKMINEIGEHVRAGKNRRTALMAILNITHPDILEFLHTKLDRSELNNFNVSIAVTDRFLEACDMNEEWYFTFNHKKYYVYSMKRVTPASDRLPEDIVETINVVALDEEDALERAKEHHRKFPEDRFENIEKYELKARELWGRLWANAFESGEPGIYNVDFSNRYTNVSYFEKMSATNPCGEIPLPSYANCCLGHINLDNMVTDGEVDWKKLAQTVRTGIRFLDDVLTVNEFPTPECREAGHRSRRVGLGVMGYHYMLIKLGLKYGSEKCLEFTERLFQTIRDEAYKTSVYLSRDKGPFPSFDRKKYLNEEFSRTLPARIRMLIKEHGIRNAVMLTVAPTGTISMVMGVSSGIEPIFSALYKRRYREASTWKETTVMDPLFKEYVEGKLPLENFVGAYDIDPKQHVQVQATIQKYIDSAISKTINLPEGAKSEDFAEFMLAYAPYMKGITVYMAGSRGQEPLEAIPLTKKNIKIYVPKSLQEQASTATAEVCMLDGECG